MLSQSVTISKLENNNADYPVVDRDILIYCDHLKSSQKDMIFRYQDPINMEIPDRLLNPFTDDCNINFAMQEDLIAVKNDIKLKPQ